jgi:hypothetical protein
MQADLDASGHSRRTYNEDMLYQLYYRRYNLNRAHRGDLNMNTLPNGHGKGAGGYWAVGDVASRGAGLGGFGLGRGNGDGSSGMQARAPAPGSGVSVVPHGFIGDASAVSSPLFPFPTLQSTSSRDSWLLGHSLKKRTDISSLEEHRTVPQLPIKYNDYALGDDNKAGDDFRSLFEDCGGQGEPDGEDGLFISQNGDRQRSSHDEDFGFLEPGAINPAAFMSTHGGANSRSPSPSFGHGNTHTTNLPVAAVGVNQYLGLKWEDPKWLSQNGSSKGGAKKSKGARGHESGAAQSEESRLAADPTAFQASERREYGSILKKDIARQNAMRKNPSATIFDLSAPVQVQELLAPDEFGSVKHPVMDPTLYMSVSTNENDAEYDVPAVGRLAPYAKRRSGRFEVLGEGSMQGTPPPYRAAYPASPLESQDKQSVEKNVGVNKSTVPSDENDPVYKPQYAFPDLAFKQVLENISSNKSMADAECGIDQTFIPPLQHVENYKDQTISGLKNANVNEVLASACPTSTVITVKSSNGNLGGANVDGNFVGFHTMGSLRRSEIVREENRFGLNRLMTRYPNKSHAQASAKNSDHSAEGKRGASKVGRRVSAIPGARTQDGYMTDSNGISISGRRAFANAGPQPQSHDLAMSFSVSKSNAKAKPVIEKMHLSGFRIPKRSAPPVPLDLLPASQLPNRSMTWKPLNASDPGVQTPSNSSSGSSHPDHPEEESRAARKVRVN